MSYQESHLIGDILKEDEGSHQAVQAPQPVMRERQLPGLKTLADRVTQGEYRSSSAPPVLPVAFDTNPVRLQNVPLRPFIHVHPLDRIPCRSGVCTR